MHHGPAPFRFDMDCGQVGGTGNRITIVEYHRGGWRTFLRKTDARDFRQRNFDFTERGLQRQFP